MLFSGLRKRHIKYAVAEALKTNSISLRDGVAPLLAQLDARQVPVLLFSAGIADVIEEVLLQQAGPISPHLHIVSNHILFGRHGDNDHIVGFSKPSYHVFNKTARSATHSPFFKTHDLRHREHLVLLGDSLGDVAMAEGLSCREDATIRIGFLNDKVERLPEYLAAYDVVIVGDPSFQFPASLVNDIMIA
jgi:cytosolic 5'-nucleotidase 3